MVDGKQQRAWDFSEPADVLQEIAKVVPGYRGLDYARLGEAGWQRTVPQAATRRSFVMAAADSTVPDPDYPLTLVTGRVFYDRGTLLRCSERIQNLVPEGFVVLHPTDAEDFGLADGDEVSVVSARGQLALTAKVSDEIVPGVVFAPRNLGETPLSVLFEDCWTWPWVRLVK
jgi:predicted molibdopterin-dependent oxidoreductase YjgC